MAFLLPLVPLIVEGVEGAEAIGTVVEAGTALGEAGGIATGEAVGVAAGEAGGAATSGGGGGAEAGGGSAIFPTLQEIEAWIGKQIIQYAAFDAAMRAINALMKAIGDAKLRDAFDAMYTAFQRLEVPTKKWLQWATANFDPDGAKFGAVDVNTGSHSVHVPLVQVLQNHLNQTQDVFVKQVMPASNAFQKTPSWAALKVLMTGMKNYADQVQQIVVMVQKGGAKMTAGGLNVPAGDIKDAQNALNAVVIQS